MSVEKITSGLSYLALGAFAAYLGFWLTEAGHQPHVLSILFSLGMAATGLALVARSGRRFAHPQSGLDAGVPYARTWDGNPISDRSSRGRAEAQAGSNAQSRGTERIPEAERHGEAALLGHEMKNYLCTLKGNARLLRQRIKGNDRDIIDRIDRVVEKLESFTQSMTATADATSSGVLWHVNAGDAGKACVKTHFHKEAQSFRWTIGPDAPALLGDPDRLDQVFLNLYSNALEAGASRVTTSVRRDGDRLQLTIEDDGRGCATEDLERIFEPFFTTKQGPARRGLGMFIVQSIVENHGGRIKVRSKNGTPGLRGLVFVLDFPAQPPVIPEAPKSRFEPVSARQKSPQWLLALPEPI
jgi:signal transduction histidine kinase